MNDDLKTFELFIFKFLSISSCTLVVAVAVRAIILISVSINSIISLIFLYSGLKSCPHSEIQWASSMAKNEIFINFKKRLSIFGINIAEFSRLVSLKDKKEIFEKCNTGKIDVLVGTHALLNDKLKFKKLLKF